VAHNIHPTLTKRPSNLSILADKAKREDSRANISGPDMSNTHSARGGFERLCCHSENDSIVPNMARHAGRGAAMEIAEKGATHDSAG
jgi:hypothetical protein